MIFTDAKTPSDTIEIQIREEAHGDLIEIEVQGDVTEVIYLAKEEARSLGQHILSLCRDLK